MQTPVHQPLATDSPGPERTPFLRFRERVRLRIGTQDLLVVRVGAERFALPVESIDELVESPRTQAVPGSPEALLGVFPFGNRLLSLYSPEQLLGARHAGAPVGLVMRGGASAIALAVDDAVDVIRIDLQDVRPAPHSEREDELVLGVLWRAPELITVIDPRALSAACLTMGSTVA